MGSRACPARACAHGSRRKARRAVRAPRRRALPFDSSPATLQRARRALRIGCRVSPMCTLTPPWHVGPRAIHASSSTAITTISGPGAGRAGMTFSDSSVLAVSVRLQARTILVQCCRAPNPTMPAPHPSAHHVPSPSHHTRSVTSWHPAPPHATKVPSSLSLLVRVVTTTTSISVRDAASCRMDVSEHTFNTPHPTHSNQESVACPAPPTPPICP